VLVDDFAELRARLSSLPPSALRPLRPAESFQVLACARNAPARFDVAAQRIAIDVEDAAGNRGRVVLPWISRASSGLERVLGECATADVIRFVAGSVSIGADGLSVLPTAIVRAQDDGRTTLLPWIDAHAASADASTEETHAQPRDSALHEAFARMHTLVADVLVAGARRADDVLLARTRDLIRQCEAVGLGRLPAIIQRLAHELEQRKHSARWDPRPAAAVLVELAAIMRLAADAMVAGSSPA
jgi:hypothetical protein